jgi:hypothetical protein
MPESAVFRTRTWLLWALASSVILVAISAIVFDVTRRAAGMKAAATRPALVLAAAPNTIVRAVVRLEGKAEADVYLAELLESVGETTYRETPTRIQVTLTAGAKVVMGSGKDVRPGAIVQVAGTMDGQLTLHASQIVILSGYIQLVSG